MLEERKRILEIEGRRFEYFRKKAHLSREEAAAQLQVSTRTLAAYERGEREINFEKTIRMSEIYKTTFEELTAYKRIIKNK